MSFDEIDLPTAKAPSMHPRVGPRAAANMPTLDELDVDLPAPRSGSQGGRPPPAPAPAAPPKDDVRRTPFDDLELDLPERRLSSVPASPNARGGAQSARGPAPKAPDSFRPDFGDLDLPMPRDASDLPAPKGATPAGYNDLDLPIPRGRGPSDSPGFDIAPKGGPQSRPMTPSPSAPSASSSTPAKHDSSSSFGDFGDLDLPIPKSAQDLPIPKGPPRSDPRPAPPGGIPSGPAASLGGGAGPVIPAPVRRGMADDDLELPEPRLRGGQGGGAGGFELDTRMPSGASGQSFPAQGGGGGLTADGRMGAGGSRFGEVSLDMHSAAADDMEFADLPQESADSAAFATSGAPPRVSLPNEIAVPAHRTFAAARPAPEIVRPSGKKALGVVVGLLLVIVLAGVALGFTQHGFFGIYALEQFLPAAGNSAAVRHAMTEARRVGSTDTYGDVRESLRVLAGARKKAGLNRTLLAQSLLHESLYQIRFGEDPNSVARARAIRTRLEDRGEEVPAMEIADAARALQEGQEARAFSLAKKAAREAPSDPLVRLATGEIALRNGEHGLAEEEFRRAIQYGAGARGQWGVARALLAKKDASAIAAVDATLRESVGHIGARIVRARHDWASGDEANAVKRAREAAGAERVNGGLLRGSAADRSEAWTFLGSLHEQRGRRGLAGSAYEAALSADPANIDALLGSGRILLDEQRYRDALARFKTVIDNNDVASIRVADGVIPPLVQAKMGAARAMIALERVQEARAMLTELARERANDGEVQLLLGRAEETLTNKPAAEQHYRNAIRLSPTSFDGYLALAQLFFGMSREGDASAVLNQARAHVQESPYMRRMLGEAELSRNRLPEAEREFRRALALEPGDTASLFGLGTTLRRSNKLDEAARTFASLAERDPGYPGLALERGRLYEALGETDDAVDNYRRALVERPNDPDLLLRLGSAQVAAEQWEAAQETLDKVIRAQPNSAEAEYFLGRVAFARGDLPQSIAHTARAVQLDGSRGEFHAHLALSEFESGNLNRSLEAVQTAIERDPRLGDAYWVRGRIRLRTGAVQDALNDLQKAIQLAPKRYEAYAAMAECYDQLRRHGDAINAYVRALEQDNTRGEWWYRLGRLRLDAGQRGEAATALSRSVVLGDAQTPAPGWLADGHRLLGDTLRLGGERAGAVEHYRRYLQLASPGAIDRAEVRQNLMDLGAAP